MREYLVSAALAVLLLALGFPVAADFIGQQDQQVQAVAEPILDSLLTGFNQGNYAQYARDFDDTLREAVSPEKFRQVRDQLLKKLGKYQEKKYLGFLNQQRFTVTLWKGRFAGTSDDVLIKLVLSQRPDRLVVVGLWFQ